MYWKFSQKIICIYEQFVVPLQAKIMRNKIFIIIVLLIGGLLNVGSASAKQRKCFPLNGLGYCYLKSVIVLDSCRIDGACMFTAIEERRHDTIRILTDSYCSIAEKDYQPILLRKLCGHVNTAEGWTMELGPCCIFYKGIPIDTCETWRDPRCDSYYSTVALVDVVPTTSTELPKELFVCRCVSCYKNCYTCVTSDCETIIVRNSSRKYRLKMKSGKTYAVYLHRADSCQTNNEHETKIFYIDQILGDY